MDLYENRPAVRVGRTARVRRRIPEAAAELIARDGIGGLRYGQVSELAEVNKASGYRNWPDRTALVADASPPTTFGHRGSMLSPPRRSIRRSDS